MENRLYLLMVRIARAWMHRGEEFVAISSVYLSDYLTFITWES